MRESPATMTEHFTPARFHPLLALVTHTLRAPSGSATIANGVNCTPGCVSGAWISSLITSTSYRAASSASATRSARSCTRPTGLCGLQSRKTPTPSAKARSRPARSSR